MQINNAEYSEPEVRAMIKAYIEEIDRLNAKLDELGHDFNNMVSTVGFMEEQVKNYETQAMKLDEENQELKDLLREIQPVLRMAFFANFKDNSKANELYDKIVKIVGKE